ncbi:MAG: HIT family protein [Parachlamydiaceae bacterium]|nr:HIT family protein [Parachlamydiaceae bacterium]
MKKFAYFLLSVLILIGAFYLFVPNFSSNMKLDDPNCAFCDQKILDNQMFYEDKLVMGLYTHKPITPGHALIIPKRHVQRLEQLTDEEMVHVFNAIKKIDRAVASVFGTSSYLILQKNGIEVGQTVPHVHFHYIPRKAGDNSALTFLFQFYISNLKSPIDSQTMKENVKKLKETIEKERTNPS